MRIFCFVLIFIFTGPVFGQRLFLVAGQSNAAGVGNAQLSPSCPSNSSFEYKIVSDELVPLQDPVGESENGFDAAKTGSAWPAFAKRYHEITEQKVFIVQTAKGGSSLNTNYFPHLRWDSLGSLWGASVHKIKKAIRKSQVPLGGIIWAQGEADASFINAREFSAMEYIIQLKKLIQRFRIEFGPTLPFYIIQTGLASGEDSNGFELIQNAQKQICEDLPYTYLIYTLTKYFPEYDLMTDYIHYNQQGYNALGKTIAEVISQIEMTNTYQPPLYEDAVYPVPSNGNQIVQLVNVGLEDRLTLDILNPMGVHLKSINLPLKKEIIELITIDLHDLANGVYYLRAYLNGHLQIFRIEVIH